MNKHQIKLPENVQLEDSTLNFYQESDSCQSEDIGQELKVDIIDGGAGKYLVIETKRWALNSDEIDQFANILKQIIEFLGTD